MSIEPLAIEQAIEIMKVRIGGLQELHDKYKEELKVMEKDERFDIGLTRGFISAYSSEINFLDCQIDLLKSALKNRETVNFADFNDAI
ncbi:hypothetical protein ACFQZ1_10255 [Bacillus sp. CGMCC 1.60114]|uniref:hypothetical protein n=1 Tax=unclassified Bacillus (in: firmicutes) TaxID=185979 RepID=UPI00363A2F7F